MPKALSISSYIYFISNVSIYLLLHDFFSCLILSGNGLNTYNESESLLKYELMDGKSIKTLSRLKTSN